MSRTSHGLQVSQLALRFVPVLMLILLISAACAVADNDGSSESDSEEREGESAESTNGGGGLETESESEPEPESVFGNGTHVVGDEVAPGIYRSSANGRCYWARLRGFSQELGDIAANGSSSPEIVTIADGDVGFETSGCGRWLPVAETGEGEPANSFEDGTFKVGVHIAPGRYRAAGGAGLCYWARFSDFSHELDGVIANGLDVAIVEIAPSDAGFTSNGCGTWNQI